MALAHSLDIFDYPARFQFGTVTPAPCGGSSCCTDTCIRMIVEYYKEVSPTLAEIRKRAQAKTNFNESPCTGINHIEVLNALQSFGINHYKVGFGVNSTDVWNYVTTGPVMVGIHYGSYPNARTACGSNKAELNGRTDCNFSGSHVVLAVGKRYHTVDGTTHKDILTRDPDHNSPSRPEQPDHDRILLAQLDKAMKNIVPYTAFTNTYIIYPTKRKVL